MAFHGGKQGGETDLPFGNIYAEYAGYNEWAKLNAIVVLYPQIQDTTFGPVNPEGCWDWWGYTDANYPNQSGRQIPGGSPDDQHPGAPNGPAAAAGARRQLKRKPSAARAA